MSSFKAAITTRTKDEIKSLTEKMMDWENLSVDQKKIVSNLHEEHFSPVSVMEKFIADILGHVSAPIGEFRKIVFQTYERYTFSGATATIDVSVTKFGFSLTRFTLKNVIERDYFDYFAQQSTEVDNFLNSKTIGVKDPLLDHLPVKGIGSTIWVTWSKTSSDPFEFVKYNKREEVYNALALSNYYLTGPIFIFRTDKEKINKKEVLVRPTIFDAGNYSPFLPPAANFKLHGLTDPYNSPTIIINGIPLNCDKRPEAIIAGSRITWEDIDEIKEL